MPSSNQSQSQSVLLLRYCLMNHVNFILIDVNFYIMYVDMLIIFYSMVCNKSYK